MEYLPEIKRKLVEDYGLPAHEICLTHGSQERNTAETIHQGL